MPSTKLSKNQNEKTAQADGQNGLRAVVVDDGAMPHDMGLAWERTDDIQGHKPRFDVVCRYHKDMEMLLRYAHITPKSYQISKLAGRKNQIEYKCPECGWIAQFFVDDSEEYFDRVMQRRIAQGIKEQYNPIDKWEEDEKIKQKLKDLGYW